MIIICNHHIYYVFMKLEENILQMSHNLSTYLNINICIILMNMINYFCSMIRI